jgi:hypothetical protein
MAVTILQLIPHLVMNNEDNIYQQICSGINYMHKDTKIYVRNLLKVRSKTHGTDL